MSGEKKELVKMEITEELANRIIGELNGLLKTYRSELEARLLTTAEAAKEDGTRLDAFKHRIKDIVGDAWDDIHNRKIDILDEYFSRQEKSGESSEDGKIALDFIECLAYAVQTRILQLRVTYNSIIGIALSDQPGNVANETKLEFDRLIGRTSNKLTGAIGRRLRELLTNKK